MSGTLAPKATEVSIPKYADGTVNKQGVALFLGIHPRTVEAYVAQKRIPFIRYSPRVLRFRLEDVQRALARRTVKEVAR